MFKQFINGYIENYGHKFDYTYNQQQKHIYGLIINPNKKIENFNVTPIGIKSNVKYNYLTFIYYPDDDIILDKDGVLKFENKKYIILNSDKIMIGENLFYMYCDLKVLEV